MFLDDRKRRILRAIIDDYIDTAEPIGSRTIARKHELGLSSATIRNEMADLEDMGYLAQPHTSAGRVPSDKGYRLYVDQLMEMRDLTANEVENIKKAMEIRINELSQLIRQTSIVMSQITKYTSIAVTPKMNKSVLKAVQVVPVDQGKALVIVVTDAGIVRNSLVKISDTVLPDFLIKISNILNDKLAGLTIEQINMPLIKEIEKELGQFKEILMPILDAVCDCANLVDNPEVYLDGTTNIFNYPEFRDIMRAKEFLNALDTRDTLFRILQKGEVSPGISIQIGAENELEEIKGCSLITATYSLDSKVIGKIGVIGPTRMEYSRVISSINYIRRMIDEEIQKLIGEHLDGS